MNTIVAATIRRTTSTPNTSTKIAASDMRLPLAQRFL